MKRGRFQTHTHTHTHTHFFEPSFSINKHKDPYTYVDFIFCVCNLFLSFFLLSFLLLFSFSFLDFRSYFSLFKFFRFIKHTYTHTHTNTIHTRWCRWAVTSSDGHCMMWGVFRLFSQSATVLLFFFDLEFSSVFEPSFINKYTHTHTHTHTHTLTSFEHLLDDFVLNRNANARRDLKAGKKIDLQQKGG